MTGTVWQLWIFRSHISISVIYYITNWLWHSPDVCSHQSQMYDRAAFSVKHMYERPRRQDETVGSATARSRLHQNYFATSLCFSYCHSKFRQYEYPLQKRIKASKIAVCAWIVCMQDKGVNLAVPSGGMMETRWDVSAMCWT